MATPVVIHTMTLTAEEPVLAALAQRALWGDDAGGSQRAARALSRVQALLGVEGVRTGVIQGGRTPAERVRLSAYGEVAASPRDPGQPWPGVLPSPAPATVLAEPVVAQLADAAGCQVVVRCRTATLSAAPVRVVLPQSPGVPVAGSHAVIDWAGPWLVPGRWWERQNSRSFLQVVCAAADGGPTPALLLSQVADAWSVASSERAEPVDSSGPFGLSTAASAGSADPTASAGWVLEAIYD